MKVSETRTIRRHAWIELPYDKVVEALKRIAAEEGHDLADVDFQVRVSDPIHLALLKEPKLRIWLIFDETLTTQGETVIR